MPAAFTAVSLCGAARIEPARGRWTLPAGYLELGESTAEGARREAFESYVKRLTRLEEIATEFKGVEKSFAKPDLPPPAIPNAATRSGSCDGAWSDWSRWSTKLPIRFTPPPHDEARYRQCYEH